MPQLLDAAPRRGRWAAVADSIQRVRRTADSILHGEAPARLADEARGALSLHAR